MTLSKFNNTFSTVYTCWTGHTVYVCVRVCVCVCYTLNTRPVKPLQPQAPTPWPIGSQDDGRQFWKIQLIGWNQSET